MTRLESNTPKIFYRCKGEKEYKKLGDITNITTEINSPTCMPTFDINISGVSNLRELTEMHACLIDFEKVRQVDLPERYIINENATILFWANGEKTVVKRCEEDEFNPRLAFLTAFFQHYCGMSKNKSNKYLASLEIEKKQTMIIQDEIKVGDKVLVKKDLENLKKYGGQSFIGDEMGKFKGKIVTISKFYPDEGEYRIKEDNAFWSWTKEMFEGKVVKHIKGENTNGKN